MRRLPFGMLVVLSMVCAGCHKKDQPAPDPAGTDAPASPPELGSDPIVEEHENGSVAWTVAPDGSVRAQVRTKDGSVVKENVSGKVVWGVQAEAGATPPAPAEIPLQFDATTGVLFAQGPKLEADLTPIQYSLVVSGKPLDGTLHVPVEGTVVLAANARASVAIAPPKGKLGPHGGVIQVVGKENYEIVSDSASAEVRVYLLDPEFHAVVLGERNITLGVYAGLPTPGLFAMTSVEGGLYARASWGVAVDPFRITMAVRTAASVSFGVVGLLPDLRMSFLASAPRIRVQVRGAFIGPDVDADLRMRARIHADNGVRDHGAGLGRHGEDRGDVRARFDEGGHHGGGDRGGHFHEGGGDRGGGHEGGGREGGGHSGGGRAGGGHSGGGRGGKGH